MMKTKPVFLLSLLLSLFVFGVGCDDDSSSNNSSGHCGNGILETGEQCDDGNTVGGDGCSSNCFLESLVCGDGILGFDEECDDGNNLDGDGCSADCLTESATCGNGAVETGEQCDDGNTTSGDGCSSTCMNEGATCGNGAVETGEQCDDGNTTNGDGCSATCQSEGAVCGNGFIEVGEDCDDGNTTSGDGCSSTCQSEGAVCGNYLVEAGEECEPPNTATCDSNCQTISTGECDVADSYDTACSANTNGQWCWDGGTGGDLFCGCDPDYGDVDCQISGYEYCNPSTNRCEVGGTGGECSVADSYDSACSANTNGQWCWDGGTGGDLFCGCDPDYGDVDCQITGYETCNVSTNLCESSSVTCGVDSFEPNESESAPATVAVDATNVAAVCSTDTDWFAFDAPGDTVVVTVTWTDDGSTDADLKVTDCSGTTLASGTTGNADNETLAVTGLTAGGTYCVNVILYSGPASGTDVDYEMVITEGVSCWLDSDCSGTDICPATVDGRSACAATVPTGAGCGDNVSGDNDRPSLAELLTSDATITESICDGNPSNPVDTDWFTFVLAEGDEFVLTVNQASGMSDGDLDLVIYDATGLLVAYAGTVENPESITGAGLPAGTYYVGVYYYDNDTATAASTTYDIVVSITAGSGCIDDGDCAQFYGRSVCNTGLCEPFEGNAAQQPGDFCDDNSDCDPSTTGSVYLTGLCFTADPTVNEDNMCLVDCDTETDCTPYGMHCAVLDTVSPMGICLPPCSSDAGCSGLTCNTSTSACE